MTWERYGPRDPPRPILVTEKLYKAIHQYAEDYDVAIQDIFNSAMVMLWSIYNGYTDSNEPKDPLAVDKVRKILMTNPMPKGTRMRYIYVSFRGEETFQWVKKLEKLYMFNGITNFIRRALSWYRREEGYLEKNERKGLIKKEEPLKKMDLKSGIETGLKSEAMVS